jgi:hypothetical protein
MLKKCIEDIKILEKDIIDEITITHIRFLEEYEKLLEAIVAEYEAVAEEFGKDLSIDIREAEKLLINFIKNNRKEI